MRWHLFFSTIRRTLRMRLRPPRFWEKPPNTIWAHGLDLALRPLTWCYRAGLFLDQWRRRRRARTLPAMVISVGNLVVGGTGKTPLTLWLADHLLGTGRRVAILSRGYGRRTRQVERVPAGARAAACWRRHGDEPTLLAATCSRVPVWVGRDRVRSGARAIAQDGATILLLDDGFQHLNLSRDLDLVLLDASRPFGNGRLLPLGPLREPVAHLDRADAVLITYRGPRIPALATAKLLRPRFPGKAIFLCEKRIGRLAIGSSGGVIPPARVRHRSVVAFAGIARPEAFFQELTALDMVLKHTLAFPDHHAYTSADIGAILEAVKTHRPEFLITTEKDLVRLPRWLRDIVLAAVLELRFDDDGAAISAFLRARIENREASSPPVRQAAGGCR